VQQHPHNTKEKKAEKKGRGNPVGNTKKSHERGQKRDRQDKARRRQTAGEIERESRRRPRELAELLR
jgi:hypothetical protein